MIRLLVLRLAACLAVFVALPALVLAADPIAVDALLPVRAAAAPLIDGTLDDAVWQGPELSTGVWGSYNPLHGEAIPQQTHVWIAYDDRYMYIAFRCDDPEAAKIKTSITRRDNIWSDDWVGLSLDALGTGQVAYHMMVNPSGVQLDMLQTNSGGEDESPDWVWDSAGRVDSTGYTVEIRLPLQSIRFKGGDVARMGVLFWRRVSRTGYSVSWPQLKPNEWVFQHHAPLVFDHLRGRATREAIPSVTYSGSEERATPGAWAAYRRRGFGRAVRQVRADLHDHRRRHGEPRLQPGRERRVPGRGQSALPGLLLGEAAVLHGRRRHSSTWPASATATAT